MGAADTSRTKVIRGAGGELRVASNFVEDGDVVTHIIKYRLDAQEPMEPAR
jgi:hypothetical protein